jgi:predicted glycoside hydrolase/deacetylase ChbG (UPF0249 family)
MSKPSHGRHLIVNADDLGQSPGINAGIARAFLDGIVTSASLMVRWPSAADAAAYFRGRAGISLGLHLDLGEWEYERGHWVPVYEVVAHNDPDAVAEEVHRQVSEFRDLTNMDPTHMDSHQHAHRSEPVSSIVKEAAKRMGVPLRHECTAVTYRGGFYGQTAKGEPDHEAISVEALLGILASLPPGVTELGCHPGLADDMGGMYRLERVREVETLCDPRVRAALAEHKIALRSFGSDLGAA